MAGAGSDGALAVSAIPPGGLVTMTRRADFLAAARARRHGRPGLVLQARKRGADETATGDVRVGYTCSKKVGNAVARNRAKRRLREAARAVLTAEGRAGWDYVLIGRSGETAARDFSALCGDIRAAIAAIHRDG